MTYSLSAATVSPTRPPLPAAATVTTQTVTTPVVPTPAVATTPAVTTSPAPTMSPTATPDEVAAMNAAAVNMTKAMPGGLPESALTEHLGLVHHVARQLKRGLAADADLEELVSAGTLGLLEAARGFDPSRGLAFSTFAAPRIRGAILDELRRHDPLPRSVRRRSRDTAAVREAMTRELGRAPTDRELAERMGVDLETFSRWRGEAEGGVRISIDRPVRDGDERSPAPMDVLHDDRAPTVEDLINRQEEAALLREAILGLKEQERVVLSLYYFEEMKLHEIATVLEVTESRVSQIRTKALARLRAELAVLRAG